MIIQKWDKEAAGELQKAIVYYSLLSEVKQLDLTIRQIELLAFTAGRGTISSQSAKVEFSRKFSSSVASVNNMISKLRELNFLIKENGKIIVNPAIDFDFSEDIIVCIKIHGIKR